MLLRHIFGPEEQEPSEQGLWAVEYSKGKDCLKKFKAFFENPQNVFEFCKKHLDDLKVNFGEKITPSIAASYFMDEYDALMNELIEAAGSVEMASNLQSLFKPLHDKDPTIRVLQCSKARLPVRFNKRVIPKIRIYAIRIDPGTYVMTGFAIKLTPAMQDRKHTNDELLNINRVLCWLKEEFVAYPEDLIRLKP